MSEIIHLRKGLNIPLQGMAPERFLKLPAPVSYAVKPTDFRDLVPKLLVAEGDVVKAGTPLFASKSFPQVCFCSPVSGTVSEVRRGEKRKLLAVVVTPDGKNEAEISPVADKSDREQLKDLLLRHGCWPYFIQRPYGVLANPNLTPRDIFVSGFDTAPLAPNLDFVLKDRREDLQAGFDALAVLAGKPAHLSISESTASDSVLRSIKGVSLHVFRSAACRRESKGSVGLHPAGNVGVQIAHIKPINKGEQVWTIDVQSLAILGELVRTGKYRPERTVVLCGAAAGRTGYFKTLAGASLVFLQSLVSQETPVRCISGNPLTGENVGVDGFAGFRNNQITLLPETCKPELFGWANPFRLKKFSTSRAYLNFLFPKRKYNLDTNMNGGVRAFMQNGIYEKVLPMDIYPVYLAKACITRDVDKMEQLGIYEVLEEDMALCEFICPSKIGFQELIKQGIALMLKEM